MIAEYLCNILPRALQEKTYIGELPTDIDNCVAIMEYGGPHGTYFAKDQLDTPYIRILVRNSSYPLGYNDVLQCKAAFTSHTDPQMLSVILTGDIQYLGRDDKRRNVWQLIYKIYSYIGGNHDN